MYCAPHLRPGLSFYRLGSVRLFKRGGRVPPGIPRINPSVRQISAAASGYQINCIIPQFSSSVYLFIGNCKSLSIKPGLHRNTHILESPLVHTCKIWYTFYGKIRIEGRESHGRAQSRTAISAAVRWRAGRWAQSKDSGTGLPPFFFQRTMA